MLYTVCFTKIMSSVDSLDPGHCPMTSILEYLKIGQVSLLPSSLHIYIWLILTNFAQSCHAKNNNVRGSRF